MFLWHVDLDVDRVGTNIANNTMVRFKVTVLVDGSGNVIILVMRLCARLGEQNRRYGSNCMVLVMLRQMYGMANFFNGVRGWRKIWVMWRN